MPERGDNMIDAYRLLRENSAEPRAGESPSGRFHTDPRKVKTWIAALPRANAQATQKELEMALQNLNGQKIEGLQRLAVLEEMRPAIMESVGLLQQQYAGSPLPLPAVKSQAAHRAEGFHVLLGNGYRKAAAEICAPAGKIPMLRGNAVNQALARAAWHYVRALSVAWRIYRAPSAGVWQSLHRVNGFATQMKLEAKPVADAVAKAPVDVRSQYVQALLMAVTNPLAFSQLEQDSLWEIARSFTGRCNLMHQPPAENAPVVPEDADRGPGPGASDESHGQWLDLRPFSDEVDAALQRARDGFSEIVPGRGVGVRVTVDMLHRLKRSFGLAAARNFKRLSAGHSLRTVIGLSGLHFYLAGQRDFETFIRQAALHDIPVDDRADWASSGTDAARVPVHTANALDQSLGGYRMAWDNANQIRARVGEVMGITLADADDDSEWIVGVVRWLRYETNGGLSAGVELLSLRAAPVGLRLYEQDGTPKPLMRAVEIHDVNDPDNGYFLAATSMESEAVKIEVVRDGAVTIFGVRSGNEDLVAGLDALVNAGDYAVLRPLRRDLVAEAPGDVDGVAA
jgi:hypothetical protein